MEKTKMTFRIWFEQFKSTFHYLDKDVNTTTSDLSDSSWNIDSIKKDYYDRGLSPLEAYNYFYEKAINIR